MSGQDLPLFVHWTGVLADLLPRTEKFPKRVRFTFSGRIDNLALDILEKIVEAQYSQDKRLILKTLNLQLEKLRVLLRISHQMGYLDNRGYEHTAWLICEAGSMVGGWIRQQDASKL